ncbi:MAG TPA: LysE family transporter [Steroidobacteraceae bacterium]|nr:LysE family transporter [Steroidobacteraceae bacterium]
MWKAFLFGVIVAGAIGPIALLIFGTAARRGFAAGAFAGLGAALADFLYALAAFSAGAVVLPYLADHEPAIRLGCALLLVALGAWMLLAQLRVSETPAAPIPAARSFLPTFLLTAVNPMTLVMFAGVVPQLKFAGSLARAAALATALAAGSAAVSLVIAGCGVALGRAMPGERARRAVTAAAAVGILAFGIYGLAAAY